MRLRIAITASFSSLFIFAPVEAKQTPSGSWSPGYNHPPSSVSGWPSNFEAINLAVIPLPGTGTPVNPGKVIAWDNNGANTGLGTGTPWPQRFTVGAPETGTFNDYVVSVPAGFGDMFCTGHVWMPDGRLFVAGGTTQYPTTSNNYFIGSRFLGIWDPSLVNSLPDHGWTFVCDPAGQNKPLGVERWYPTVTLLGNNQIMVAGGVVDTNTVIHNICGNASSFDAAIDTYEIWDIASNDWVRDPTTGLNVLFAGPEHAFPYFGNCFSMFGEYPRQHLISSGDLFVAGMYRGANHVHHATAPAIWKQDPPNPNLDTVNFRNYGASVLVPNVGNRPAGLDKVWIIGGSDSVNSTNSVQSINGFSGTAWVSAPSMNVSRMVANTVLLADGAILEVGGCTGLDYFNYPSHTPELRPEIYRKSVNNWVFQAPQASPRMYHSTAALLPSGNVVSAGGDIRTWDWEVFTPDYLSNGQFRPAFSVPPPTNLAFNTNYMIPYTPMPPGLHVDRVVLMRPCSITHHSDMDQRYVELVEPPTVPPPNTIMVTTPPTPNPIGTAQGSVIAPPGWYMMFLVSNTGTPSIAAWVNLQ
jgi:hypothetical protein